jgi:shikimate dehydrogenase
VIDLVYKPLETSVLSAARARGLKTVDGLGMLLWQGALAFERWTGKPAPVEAMRAAL